MLYRNPKPTVDVVIQAQNGVVLVRRANPPHGWALPGGFIDEGESAESAAVREVLEREHRRGVEARQHEEGGVRGGVEREGGFAVEAHDALLSTLDHVERQLDPLRLV